MIPVEEQRIKISKYFTLKEVCVSKSIAKEDSNYEFYKNNKYIQENVSKLCNELLDPIRMYVVNNGLQKGLRLSSCIRSPESNSNTAGASKTSHHMLGLAADIVFDNEKVWNKVIEALYRKEIKDINYDKIAQVIKEVPRPSWWLHIGYRPKDWKRGLEYLYYQNKKLYCEVKNTYTSYPWITDNNFDKVIKL